MCDCEDHHVHIFLTVSAPWLLHRRPRLRLERLRHQLFIAAYLCPHYEYSIKSRHERICFLNRISWDWVGEFPVLNAKRCSSWKLAKIQYPRCGLVCCCWNRKFTFSFLDSLGWLSISEACWEGNWETCANSCGHCGGCAVKCILTNCDSKQAAEEKFLVPTC